MPDRQGVRVPLAGICPSQVGITQLQLTASTNLATSIDGVISGDYFVFNLIVCWMIQMNYERAATAILSLFFGSAGLNAEMINILVVDQQVGSDAGFGTGGRYEDAYNDLLDPANFGDMGTVDRNFVFAPAVANLDSVDLSDIGLIIAAHTHQSPLSSNDMTRIEEHVRLNGASVLALGHSFRGGSSSIVPVMTNRFVASGALPSYKFPRTDTATVSADPAGSAPGGPAFGTVSGQLVRTDAHHYFTGSTSGASGAFSMSYTDNNNQIFSDGLFGDHGDGRYSFVGSVNMFGDGAIDASGSTTLASDYNFANNQAYFLNTIDFLTENTIMVNAAVPEPSSLLLVAFPVACLTLQRRRRLHAHRAS